MPATMPSLSTRALLGWIFALFLSAASAQGLAPIPPLQARVTDQAGMLKPEQRVALENVLKEYEDRTGNQIAILLVSSTAPEVIEQYSIRVADAWKLGRKGVDDGVILLVAKDNPPGLRRLRIESGRGVQGVLTDAQSKRILQDVIAPHFRQNDYYGGLSAGISAITSLLDQEKFAPPDKKAKEENGSWLPFIIFGLFVFLAIFRSFRRNRLSHHGWGRSSGIILGGGFGRDRGSWHDDGGFGGGGGFSGGGGGFDGGGASGDW